VSRVGTVSRPAVRARSRRRAPARRVVVRGLLALAVALLLVVELFPLVWMVLSSFKTDAEFTTKPVWSLPAGLDWSNWSQAWTEGNLQTYLRNSALATFPSLAMLIVLGLGAAFGLEVMRWRGRSLVMVTFLAGIMIPLQMVLLPLFTVYFHLHLIDSLWALVITYTAYGLPLTVFIMAGFFKAVPREVLEAATIDGASIYGTFLRVALPMVANAILTVALVEFFFIWNDLLLSLTFISEDSHRTIQTGLLNFTGQYGQISWGPTFAAITITVLPTLALYLFLNQRIIRGLTAGSLKG
jgi:raffinose/stachyose/melibiose transport system permease protein